MTPKPKKPFNIRSGTRVLEFGRGSYWEKSPNGPPRNSTLLLQDRESGSSPHRPTDRLFHASFKKNKRRDKANNNPSRGADERPPTGPSSEGFYPPQYTR